MRMSLRIAGGARSPERYFVTRFRPPIVRCVTTSGWESLAIGHASQPVYPCGFGGGQAAALVQDPLARTHARGMPPWHPLLHGPHVVTAC